jgi:S-DNA-T family DNA segregation ATPase FtsK/SpoIIIE
VTLAKREPDDELERIVIDAELVDDDELEEESPRRPMLAAGGKAVAVVTTLRGPAKRAGLAACRCVWLTGQGCVSCVRRAHSAATHGKLRAQIRAAEAAGRVDPSRPAYSAYSVPAGKSRTVEAAEKETVAVLERQLKDAKDARSRRLCELPQVVAGVVGAVAIGALVVFGLLVLGGIGVHSVPGGVSWASWWSGIGTVLLVVGTILQWSLWLAGWAAGPLALLLLYREGRDRAQTPTWLLAPASRDLESIVVTPAGIATALAHLNIGPLNKAIKDGWLVEFATPPVRVNNRGYAAVHSLPMGVTPGMIADARAVLARNLFRAPLEVWPVEAERAGFVDLWVADAGASKRPASEYPLLHEGAADVFTSVPFGESQRGDVIGPPMMGANLVFGGIMGQGKSNAARVVMAGCALDPICELLVFVFAGNGDFDAYEPRLACYERGVDDDVVVKAVATLRGLYAEVAEREAILAELGAKKVTRTLALQHPALRPKVALFSECHELFGHKELGEEAAELAVQTMRRSRKTGIILGFDTQSSRKDAIPPKIVELVKLNACFAVKSWRSNDGFLGDGSFAAGIRATELRPGKDVGTSVLTGATAERFEILKWFFIEVNDDTGFDAAADLIERSLENVHPAVSVGGGRRAEVEVERDLLVDLDAVLGHEPLPTADIPALLRGHAPTWPRYRSLTGKALREWLARDHGIKVASTGNRWPLDPATVREALAARSLEDGDGDE